MTSSAVVVPSPVQPVGVPDPGEPVPALALPTVGLFVGSLAVWGLTTYAALGLGWSPWLTIPVYTAVSFVMFTVLHDAVHYSISRRRWVNALLGRLSIPFVVPYAAAPLFGFVHIEHHRNTNEEIDTDPDAWATDGPWWQLPLRWLTIDIWYAVFYVKNIRRRSPRELAEVAGIILLFVVGVVVAARTGTLLTVALTYLVPARIALGLLAWWFDWLPHHGLRVTQRENRYRAAIMTAFGRELTPAEYRVWRELDSSLARLRPVEVPAGSSASHAELHRLPVAALDRLTEDSVAITFSVPPSCGNGSGSPPGSTSRCAPTSVGRGCGATIRSARRPPPTRCGSRSSGSRVGRSPPGSRTT